MSPYIEKFLVNIPLLNSRKRFFFVLVPRLSLVEL